MCGICGVVQIRGEPRPVVSRAVLGRMTDLMSHRGPNDRGLYLDDGIALGVRRLSIVDVAGGHQPVSNEDGRIWAVQNGELYNHEELRTHLGDQHQFRSRCDTEILPHLYERHGNRFPSYLRGKYGIAVWDGIERKAVVVRDRLGIKPLYYAECDDVLVFASELKSVLGSGLVDPALDYEAIDAYLTLGFIPAPRTPLAGISKLPPGHRLIVHDGRFWTEPYWRYPEPAADSRARGVDEYAEGFLAELEESVRLRLMSDVPLGAMLSGGLDSSVIVALMARNSSEAVKTFSVGFVEARGQDNELEDARRVASAFGADHHELELSVGDLAVDLEDLVWHMDEPVADLSALGFFALSELAARHVTVALSGQGADELLGGYRKHRAAAIVREWQRVPGVLRRPVESLGVRGPDRFRRAARTLAAPDPAARLIAMSGQFDPDLRRRLVRGPLAALDGGAALRAARGHLNGVRDDPLSATLYLDGQLGLVDDMLHYFDRTSMAHSLEVRVPFLDHHVVEYCAGIPNRLKVRRLSTTKYLLRHAARGLVPDQVIDKPKVSFFRGVVDEWFKTQTKTAISEFLLAPAPRYAELLHRRRIEQMVAGHANGSQAGNAHLLHAVLLLEIWLSSYLPRALGPRGDVRDRIAVAV